MSRAVTHRVLPGAHQQVRETLRRLESATAGTRTLAAGDTGGEVKALQRTLRGLDLYAGPVNGRFGASTTTAVNRLEAQLHAPSDGVVDTAEVKAMRARQVFVKDGFETQAHVGQKGRDLQGVEHALQSLGFHPGAVDGVFDEKLARAVKAYRQSDASVPDQFKGIGPHVQQGLERQVKRLESNLRELGRKPGTVDGTYTTKTADAVRAFQKKHGLAVTGIANERTRKAIDDEVRGGGARVQKFIDVAKDQVGAPYVFGSAGPNAFDCSGLIAYALEHAGVSGTRTTAAGYQSRYADSKVDRAHLQPGDLVFLWYPNDRGIPPGTASHIEIYLGNGKTMGTDNPSEGARIEPIDWNGFIGGARVPGLRD